MMACRHVPCGKPDVRNLRVWMVGCGMLAMALSPAMVVSASDGRPEYPLVMMRFSPAQTRSVAEWKQTAKALAEHPGCCDSVWFSSCEICPSLSWHREHLTRLQEAAADVRKLGIDVSLQIEATIGHGDEFISEESSRLFDKYWTGWTGPDGTECVYSNCPRQPAFLKRMADMSEIYAEIRPSVVWIDDDLRIAHHSPVEGKDAPGCWCAKCVADFSAEEKRSWTRETLFADYRQDAKLRDRWYDFSSRSLAEVACTIARAFRKISPNTRMGLQTGADRARMTAIVVRALARETGEKVGVRMGAGSYWDLSPYAALAKSTQMVEHRRVLSIEDVVDNWCTEVETCPRAYGSRSVRSIAIEAFSSIAWGFDTTSLFVMDRRSETDELYSRYLLGPLAIVSKFLNGYRAANRGTEPAGFICPGLHFGDTRKLMGLPILPGFGRSWGEISSEHERFSNSLVVWDLARADLMPPFEKTPSAKLQIVRDRLSKNTPLELLSPFVGLVLPRVSDDGALRSVGLIGTRLDPQFDILLRVDTSADEVVWHELGETPRRLSVVEAGGCRRVTVPSIGAWNMGYLVIGGKGMDQ